MPCFSTGIPVINDAIVGNRNAGLTAVADQVTAPSLIKRLRVGIVPPLKESWPNPSRTKRMTCSVGGVEAIDGSETTAGAGLCRRSAQGKIRDIATIQIDHPRARLMSVFTGPLSTLFF